MLPVRILIVANTIGLQRRLYTALDRGGFAVSIGAGGPPPALTLARNCPDLLILEVSPALGRITAWQRSIASFRSRRPLCVLAIAPESTEREDRNTLEEIADLGLLVRPTTVGEILQRVGDWYDAETPLVQAG